MSCGPVPRDNELRTRLQRICTRAMLERYRQHVFHYRRKTDGLPLSFQCQCQGKRLIAVRVFFQWLTRQHHLMFNPASELELPRPEKRLPRHILTIAEVEQVINTCDTTEPTDLGLRDRAMLETLYSTGLRRSELVELHIDDVDRPRGPVHVRQGKGKKDRVVPIGGRACRWVQRYLWEVRERYVELPDGGHLFLAKHGEAMQGKKLSVIVKLAIERANLERFQTTHPNAACHLFRHACATHMLEAGADIRFIQALLGHADLSTTEVYTQVSIGKLKAVHTATHPARLQARLASNADALDPDPQATADALLRALEQRAARPSMSAEPFEFIAIGFEVEFEQACALAEVLHGMPLAQWRLHARDDAQALRAHEAASYLLQSLIEHGFDPR